MSLDGYVRCSCIRDGKVKKPHPLPDRLMWDDSNAPYLNGDPTDDEWEAHDEWVRKSCEHQGFLASEFLGNITRVKNVREFLKGLQGKPGPMFPILLKKVVYNGTHTGDWLPAKQTPALLKEVDLVLASRDILTPGEKEFFESMRRLCEASIATGNPISF
ncbi:MAG: hypothetical protein WA477_25100 [Candidatus Sulfotelmatobacter sp.]